MPNDTGLTEISEAVGLTVRKYREARGWSIEQLAERCAAVGAATLTVNALYVIEAGRREKETGRRRRLVTVDELLALAAALDMHPVDLLIPPELDDDEPYNVAPAETTPAKVARAWIGGGIFLHGWPSFGSEEWVKALQHLPTRRAMALAPPTFNWQIVHKDREETRSNGPTENLQGGEGETGR